MHNPVTTGMGDEGMQGLLLQGLTTTPRRFGTLLLACFLFAASTTESVSADSAEYDYYGVDKNALALYRQGWSEILERGRWTEAERLYREAMLIDPDFIIGKSVLARITDDPKERQALTAEIERDIDGVDTSGRWVLDPYLMTLLLINARESAQTLPEDFRRDLAQLAVKNYRSFLQEYPGEWAVRVEYIEWIHAQQGPENALTAIEEMQEQDSTSSVRMSYFPAYFYAELGDYPRATALAEQFVESLGPGDWPQAHYIAAFIAYQREDYAVASDAINRALRLDPKHLIAQRLRKEIDAAIADSD
ncbi:MAG: hypothetical protein NWP69_07205 [Congregibacter sp.]|nr:hypothetical protein [Congregibacter sp.]